MKTKRNRRFGIALLAALGLAGALPSGAGVIPSKAEEAPVAGAREADRERIQDILARDEVAKALAARGLPPQEVEQRLARLSAQDLRTLASNLDQIQAAGNVPKYIWVLLAIFLAVSILAAVF